MAHHHHQKQEGTPVMKPQHLSPELTPAGFNLYPEPKKTGEVKEDLVVPAPDDDGTEIGTQFGDIPHRRHKDHGHLGDKDTEGVAERGTHDPTMLMDKEDKAAIHDRELADESKSSLPYYE